MKLTIFRRNRTERASSLAQFHHGHIFGSGCTSICLRCFRTVATTKRESELRSKELNHICSLPLPEAHSRAVELQ